MSKKKGKGSAVMQGGEGICSGVGRGEGVCSGVGRGDRGLPSSVNSRVGIASGSDDVLGFRRRSRVQTTF